MRLCYKRCCVRTRFDVQLCIMWTKFFADLWYLFTWTVTNHKITTWTCPKSKCMLPPRRVQSVEANQDTLLPPVLVFLFCMVYWYSCCIIYIKESLTTPMLVTQRWHTHTNNNSCSTSYIPTPTLSTYQSPRGGTLKANLYFTNCNGCSTSKGVYLHPPCVPIRC